MSNLTIVWSMLTYDIKHRPSEPHANADGLSCLPYCKLPSKAHTRESPFRPKIVYRVSYTLCKRPPKHKKLHRLRTCIASVAHVQMAKRHASYNVAFKCSAITWPRQHGRNVSKTAREFEVDPKRIREWNSKYEDLIKLNRGTSKKCKNLSRGRCSVTGS